MKSENDVRISIIFPDGNIEIATPGCRLARNDTVEDYDFPEEGVPAGACSRRCRLAVSSEELTGHIL